MKTKLVLCAILACIASAVALGQTVSVNYNKSQSFSQFHTYAWGGDNANQIQNSILAQQAKSDIAKNKSLVWRGIAQNTLSNNGNKNSQMVSKAVQKMFKQWPAA
jgi:hypothetical protein